MYSKKYGQPSGNTGFNELLGFPRGELSHSGQPTKRSRGDVGFLIDDSSPYSDLRSTSSEPKSFDDKCKEKDQKKLEALLAGSKLAMLQSSKYIEPSEVSRVGKRMIKKQKKAEREKTKGPGWYNMGAPEMTAERKNDMEALRLRGALETKRFYKRNNITTLPKYFQVGRVVETPADYYSSRIPKKQRKQTLAQELVAEIE